MTKEKSKIRKILEGYICNYHPYWHDEDVVFEGIDESDLDKLEKELQEHYDKRK